MRMLGSAADIKKGVYLPGNHDHTIWTNYVEQKYRQKAAVTKPEGELLIQNGQVVGNQSPLLELLTIFFSYPQSSQWRAIAGQQTFDFAIANPIYARHFKGRTYVFAHGTHFRPDVTLSQSVKRLADWSQADRLAGLEIDSSGDVSKAHNMEELEAIATKLVDTLWPSSRDNPNSRSDRLWYVLTMLSGKFAQQRATPDRDQLYTWAMLQAENQDRIKRLVDANGEFLDDSLELWQKFFARHMFPFLESAEIPTQVLTFVYGDTHRGGWGELNQGERQIRFYNTGGWGTTNKKNHPACHIFAVDQQGEEFMLDVSFADVNILGMPLVELAAQDAEDRHSLVGKVLRPLFD